MSKVIDFSAHLYPDEPEVLSRQHTAPFRETHQFLGDLHDEGIHTDLDRLMSVHEQAGIDGAVISQPLYFGMGDTDRVKMANDSLWDSVADIDDYYALAAVPTAAGGEDAVAELERCIDRGFHGGVLETKSDGIELHHDAVQPVLAYADREEVPLMVHPKLHDSLHEDVLSDEVRLNAVFGREVALMESVFNVVHHGVLDRHDNLTLVYHHNAGNLASKMGRIHMNLDEGRWPGQEHVKPFDEFKRQLERNIYLDTSGYFGYHSAFRATLEEFPAKNLLFGTDYPYETRMPATHRKIMDTIADLTSHTDTRRVLGDNAFEVLVNT